jgi:hypothetical protein
VGDQSFGRTARAAKVNETLSDSRVENVEEPEIGGREKEVEKVEGGLLCCRVFDGGEELFAEDDDQPGDGDDQGEDDVAHDGHLNSRNALLEL